MPQLRVQSTIIHVHWKVIFTQACAMGSNWWKYSAGNKHDIHIIEEILTYKVFKFLS